MILFQQETAKIYISNKKIKTLLLHTKNSKFRIVYFAFKFVSKPKNWNHKIKRITLKSTDYIFSLTKNVSKLNIFKKIWFFPFICKNQMFNVVNIATITKWLIFRLKHSSTMMVCLCCHRLVNKSNKLIWNNEKNVCTCHLFLLEWHQKRQKERWRTEWRNINCLQKKTY